MPQKRETITKSGFACEGCIGWIGLSTSNHVIAKWIWFQMRRSRTVILEFINFLWARYKMEADYEIESVFCICKRLIVGLFNFHASFQWKHRRKLNWTRENALLIYDDEQSVQSEKILLGSDPLFVRKKFLHFVRYAISVQSCTDSYFKLSNDTLYDATDASMTVIGWDGPGPGKCWDKMVTLLGWMVRIRACY